MNTTNIIINLNIVIQAIENNDIQDALKMLADIQEDLKILSLIP